MDGTLIAHLLETRILPPSDIGSHVQIVLRSLHLVAGIAWIGLLYFFNLVGFPAMRKFDLPTRGKVIPTLLAPALWWFRWGAVVTVLAGFIYWVLILQTEPPEQPGAYVGRTVGLWFALVVVTFGIQFGLLRIPVLTKNTWVFVLVVLLLVGGMGHFMVQLIAFEGASNRTLSIAVGGGLTLALITQGVLRLEPWFAPRYLIPLGGMIFANAMNSVSIL